MKTAIVHDWLVNYAGSERVVYELSKMYPEAPIYTSVYDEAAVGKYFPRERVRTTFLQKIPGAIKHHQLLFPLMPVAFESLDLKEFDLVISSSHACSKGVITRADAVHVCYCHTPTRYLWSHYHDYSRTVKLSIARSVSALVLHKMRLWDFAAAQRVDFFIANSAEVQRRIRKYYGRDSLVVHPPVTLTHYPSFDPSSSNRDYYLYLGRLVQYKRVDLAIHACNKLGVRLVVAGDGPERKSLAKIAGPTIEFRGVVSEQEKVDLISSARALIFCGEEDFGIVMVESLMLGTPVVAYERGGALEILNESEDSITFGGMEPDLVTESVKMMTLRPFIYEDRVSKTYSAKFSEREFRRSLSEFIRGVLS